MKNYQVTCSRVIGARPERVYQVIRDMSEHRKILPKEFERMEVLLNPAIVRSMYRRELELLNAYVTA